MIFINSENQKLHLVKNNDIVFESDISTSRYGLGCISDSYKTPVGLHLVSSMIGDGLPVGTLFNNRVASSKIINYIPHDDDDYITSRIIRLSGLEEGTNKGGNVDTFDRYIYIHGTPHSDKLGRAESHGCIRMSDADVIKLYNLVNLRELVLIN